jgi:hypothetical protein
MYAERASRLAGATTGTNNPAQSAPGRVLPDGCGPAPARRPSPRRRLRQPRPPHRGRLGTVGRHPLLPRHGPDPASGVTVAVHRHATSEHPLHVCLRVEQPQQHLFLVRRDSRGARHRSPTPSMHGRREFLSALGRRRFGVHPRGSPATHTFPVRTSVGRSLESPFQKGALFHGEGFPHFLVLVPAVQESVRTPQPQGVGPHALARTRVGPACGPSQQVGDLLLMAVAWRVHRVNPLAQLCVPRSGGRGIPNCASGWPRARRCDTSSLKSGSRVLCVRDVLAFPVVFARSICEESPVTSLGDSTSTPRMRNARRAVPSHQQNRHAVQARDRRARASSALTGNVVASGGNA